MEFQELRSKTPSNKTIGSALIIGKDEILVKTPEGDYYKINLINDVYSNIHNEKKLYGITGNEFKKLYGTTGNEFINSIFITIIDKLKNKILNNEEISILDFGCGRSVVTNALALYISENMEKIKKQLNNDISYKNLLDDHKTGLQNAITKMSDIEEDLNQMNKYGSIAVVRYDPAIANFSIYPPDKAFDAVISLDVIEHISAKDFEEFKNNLMSKKKEGGIIIANISNRNAVNYSSLNLDVLSKIEQEQIPEDLKKQAITLEKKDERYEGDDKYLMNLHINVRGAPEWEQILKGWQNLASPDPTATMFISSNTSISDDIIETIYSNVVNDGFIDLIKLPTKENTKYSTDPILHERVENIQFTKHISILNWCNSAIEKSKNESELKNFIKTQMINSYSFIAHCYDIQPEDFNNINNIVLDKEKKESAILRIRGIEEETKNYVDSKYPQFKNETEKQNFEVGIFNKKIEEKIDRNKYENIIKYVEHLITGDQLILI